jgi:DNA-directed RNA polymerase subunit alpha
MLQLELFLQILFYPVKNVKYAIENFRVEQKTDYEKLVLK